MATKIGLFSLVVGVVIRRARRNRGVAVHTGGSRAERLARKARRARKGKGTKGGKNSSHGDGSLSGRFVADVDENGVLRCDLKYVDTFLGWHCGQQLLAMGLFPGSITQEISESMACLAAATGRAGLDIKDDSVLCVVVGDGRTPRTAALLG